MGAECPECHKHGAYVMAITASGEPAKKNDDIIARKLTCGHVIGSTDFVAYRKQLEIIEGDEATAIRKIKEAGKAKRLGVWQKIQAIRQEV